MCEWGTHEIVNTKCPARDSHTREAYMHDTKIDACIAPIIKALQEAGIDMLGSCCGHGKAYGWIPLDDGSGRLLAIFPDADRFLNDPVSALEAELEKKRKVEEPKNNLTILTNEQGRNR